MQEANHVTFCQETFSGYIDTSENENVCWQAVILAVSSESKMAANITKITFEFLVFSLRQFLLELRTYFCFQILGFDVKLNSFAICNFTMSKISKMATKMIGKMIKFLFSQIVFTTRQLLC